MAPHVFHFLVFTPSWSPLQELVCLIIEYGRSNSIFIEVQLIYNIVLVSGVQQSFTWLTDYTVLTVIVKCYLFSLCCAYILAAYLLYA